MAEENEKPETREEIIEDIEESGVPEEVAKEEEKLAEEMEEESEKMNEEDNIEEAIDEAVEETEESESDDNETSKEDSQKSHDRESREYEAAPWVAKTKLGKEVKEGKIKDIDELLDSNRKILEAGIVDALLNVQSELIAIGQSKGKFGGGKRRAWRQTQKKTKEGNIPSFSAFAVVGDENGHIGIGEGKAKETLPARDKAVRKAKLNLIKVTRGCGGFNCACAEEHSIPFEVSGKSGSVTVRLIPAPQGTGLVVANELKKILQLAGIKDVYSKTSGKKRTTFNLIKACMKALKKTNRK